MTNSTTTIFCGSCKCEAEGFSEPEGDKYVLCPRCNRRDSLDHAVGVVLDYVAHTQLQRVHDGLVESVLGSETIKITSDSPQKGDFRWVTNLDL